MKQSHQEHRNRNEILNRLMKAQRDGQLSGIYGRLGDLGTIDQRYDIAVSTACGFLDHIVVDTVPNAEACIKYLRDHRIGAGKFICLDKVSQQNS